MNSKLDYIDSIRGLAILMVIMVHCGQYGLPVQSDVAKKVLDSGAMGVQLFFVASAFTLFLSYSSRIRKEKRSATSFFIRRFFRIAPMYYLGILYFSWQNPENITIERIISNLTFLHGIHPDWINTLVPGGWSIAVEMMFYCMFPFLYRKIKSLNKAVSILSITLILDIIFQLCIRALVPATKLVEDLLYYYLPHQLPIFFCGIILYFLLIKKDYQIPGRTLLLLCPSLLFHTVYFQSSFLLFAGVFALLFIGLSKVRYKALVNPFFQFIGKISFSAYLVHFAVLYWLNRLGLVNYMEAGKLGSIFDYCIRLSIVIGFTSLLAYLFYKIVEMPMQNLGKALIERINFVKRDIKIIEHYKIEEVA